MIILERSTSSLICWFPIIIKKIDLKWEKDYTSQKWCSVRRQNWQKKIQCSKFCSVGVWAVLRFLVIKNFGHYEKLSWEICEEKKHFAKYFVVCKYFLELQSSDGLVDFLVLWMFINAFLC